MRRVRVPNSLPVTPRPILIIKVMEVLMCVVSSSKSWYLGTGTMNRRDRAGVSMNKIVVLTNMSLGVLVSLHFAPGNSLVTLY